MFTITPRQLQIIEQLKLKSGLAFSELFAILGTGTSERTLKRDLTDLAEVGVLATVGGGRSLVYTLTTSGRLFIPVEVARYGAQEPDSRAGALTTYQFDVWGNWPQAFARAESEDGCAAG